MRVPVDYPTATEERAIVARMADHRQPACSMRPTWSASRPRPGESRSTRPRSTTRSALVLATRDPAAHDLPKLVGLLSTARARERRWGLVRSARAMALLRGRERAVPQDVYDVAYDILNARLALSYRALAEGSRSTTSSSSCSRRSPLPVRTRGRRRRRSPRTGTVRRRRNGRPPHGGRRPTSRGRHRSFCRAINGHEVTSAPGAGLDLPARLRRIELAVSQKVFGRRDGRHPARARPRRRAREARPYEPGDDVRRMDWSILARTGEPHVRDAIQERDLDVAVLVDRSGSLDFGTVGWRKADLALSVAAAVSALAVLGGDRIGAVVATADGPRIVPIRVVDGTWRASRAASRGHRWRSRSISVAPSTACGTSCAEADSRSRSRTSSLP